MTGATPTPDRRVVGLHVYPFKSAGGMTVDSVEVDEVGLKDDRRWMIVDADGAFVSQRTRPRMALLRTRFEDDALVVTAPQVGPLRLDRREPAAEGHGVHRVWFSDRYSVDCGDEPAEWASDFLGMACRVLRAVRPPDAPPLTPEGRVQAGFSDASPALVASLASLTDLNRRLDAPLPMDRFRPNIVVDGYGPFEEDRWGGDTLVGRVPTRGGRPCPRCATTLVDQRTAAKGVEPLRTLATFRKNAEGGVDFGVNIYFEEPGTIRVGDAVVQQAPAAD